MTTTTISIIKSDFIKSGLGALLLTVGIAVLGSSITTPAKAELSARQQNDVTSLIESYIRENPSVIRDVLAKLAADEALAMKQAAFQLLADDIGDPAIGPVDASITIYEFSDYNCGYCKRLFPTMMDVLAEAGDVKLVVKELPIIAESSLAAAQAGIAAQKQQKFPAFHAALMKSRGKTDDKALIAAAKQAGLDIAQWRSDMNSPLTIAILRRTEQAAMAFELRGTPALIIGTQVIPGAVPKEQILQAIAEARKNS